MTADAYLSLQSRYSHSWPLERFHCPNKLWFGDNLSYQNAEPANSFSNLCCTPKNSIKCSTPACCWVKTQWALLCFGWQSPPCCLGVGLAPCGAQLFSKTGLWNCVACAQWGSSGSCWTGPFLLKPNSDFLFEFFTVFSSLFSCDAESGRLLGSFECLLSTRWCSSSPMAQATLE